MPLTMPNEIENETPADALEVNQNFDVIEQYTNTNVILRDGSVRMQAQLSLFGDPVNEDDAVRKSYVDAILPVGVMLPYGGPAAPAGQWALCNGAAVQTALFPELFKVYNYRYGGSGGTFLLPNMCQRVMVGLDPAVELFNTTGKTGGGRDAIIPNHLHPINHDHGEITSTNNDVSHTHPFSDTTSTTSSSGAHTHAPQTGTRYVEWQSSGGIGASAAGPNFVLGTATESGGAHTHTVSVSGTTGVQSANHKHKINLPMTAGMNSANPTGGVAVTEGRMQPYVVVTFICRTG